MAKKSKQKHAAALQNKKKQYYDFGKSCTLRAIWIPFGACEQMGNWILHICIYQNMHSMHTVHHTQGETSVRERYYYDDCMRNRFCVALLLRLVYEWNWLDVFHITDSFMHKNDIFTHEELRVLRQKHSISSSNVVKTIWIYISLVAFIYAP